MFYCKIAGQSKISDKNRIYYLLIRSNKIIVLSRVTRPNTSVLSMIVPEIYYPSKSKLVSSMSFIPYV